MIFLYFVLEVGGFLLIAMVIDYLVGKINFNKYISHLCVETVFLYPFRCGVAIMGKWFGATVLNVVVYSLIYIGGYDSYSLLFFIIYQDNRQKK